MGAHDSLKGVSHLVDNKRGVCLKGKLWGEIMGLIFI